MKVDKYGYDLTFFNGVYMGGDVIREKSSESKSIIAEANRIIAKRTELSKKLWDMDDVFSKCKEFDTYVGKYYKLENLYPNTSTSPSVHSTNNDYIKILNIGEDDSGRKYLKCLKFKKLGELHTAIDLGYRFSFYVGDYMRYSEISETEFFAEWAKILDEINLVCDKSSNY